jgi:A/G-specific adenine glycosylase
MPPATIATPLTPDLGTSAALARALLRWYLGAARALPWRAPPGKLGDPYRVMVSEAMLQQTQVATVVDYFDRFIESLPTLADLAAAPQQQVLHLWQGLGYYRRARHLHAAAGAIVQRHDGEVPDKATELLKLPGIGRYTAGAIASIAFGQPAPIVDGNVARVLGRLLGERRAVDEPALRKLLWSFAGKLVETGQGVRINGVMLTCGDLNQAIMELGATVCTPRNPDCPRCPLRRWCVARHEGQVHQCPGPARRAKVRQVSHHVVAVARRGRFLMQQRDDGGLWAGLWQMPTWEGPHDTPPGETELAAWVGSTTGLRVGAIEPGGRFVHRTTHRLIDFELWIAGDIVGRLRSHAGRWCSPGAIDRLPMSNPQRRILEMLGVGLGGGGVGV